MFDTCCQKGVFSDRSVFPNAWGSIPGEDKDLRREGGIWVVKRGSKGPILAKNVFLNAWGSIPGEDWVLRWEGTTGGPKGGFRKNVFFYAWGRIHGEDWVLRREGTIWGVKRAFSQKWIFKCLGEDSWRRHAFRAGRDTIGGQKSLFAKMYF